MYDQRVQLLLTREQKRRLEAEARARKMSVNEIIRSALDSRFRLPTRAERIRAAREFHEIAKRNPWKGTIEDIVRMIEERDDGVSEERRRR